MYGDTKFHMPRHLLLAVTLSMLFVLTLPLEEIGGQELVLVLMFRCGGGLIESDQQKDLVAFEYKALIPHRSTEGKIK